MKKVLSIAGSDCSGGAGIQADLKTFSAHGVFGMSVIVSVVAENTSRVIDIQDITPDMIEKQIDAVFEDIEVDAVKIGMLSTPECMKAVAKKLLQYKPQNVVIDPVMYAKNGCPLMNPTAVSTLIDTVIPLADVLTPNIPEAEKIADMQISTVSDMEAAARKIYAMGCKAIVVKGGHHIGNAVDVLFNGENFYHFETSRIDTKNTHGTGCTFLLQSLPSLQREKVFRLQSNLQRLMSQWQSNTLLRLEKAVARRTISTNCISMVYLKNRQVQNEL